ncbi:AhpC-TSA-domain-containing protein [Xylariaceae sp. FL1272]|nr:AhpC-TSA-domain-containing protein [Xylariaceae sp. FL1272]
MPIELRKRKAPPPPPPPAKKRQSKVAKAASATKATVIKPLEKLTEKPPDVFAKKPAVPAVGDIISLDGFGGEIETNDGAKTTLKALVDESKAGVVLFTYPKASTPGCTKQVCFFRDSYDDLTKDGLAIYGLSKDAGKANTTFKTKQKLQYPLLCDPAGTLIDAIGLKKAPSGTTRGVFVVDKAGKVLLAEPGSPAGTVEAVKKLVAAGSTSAAKDEPVAVKPAESLKPTSGEAVEENKVGEREA